MRAVTVIRRSMTDWRTSTNRPESINSVPGHRIGLSAGVPSGDGMSSVGRNSDRAARTAFSTSGSARCTGPPKDANTPCRPNIAATRGHRRSDSVQCSEAAARTRSYTGCSDRSSNAARTATTVAGTCFRSSASIAGSGSVAVTSIPREANARVALPVPAPISNARWTGRPAYASTASTSSSGYSGRNRSYADAAEPKLSARSVIGPSSQRVQFLDVVRRRAGSRRPAHPQRSDGADQVRFPAGGRRGVELADIPPAH